MQKIAIFAFLFLTAVFVIGYVINPVGSSATTEPKKLNLGVQNLSTLIELNVPLECMVHSGSSSFFLQIKNRTFRVAISNRVLVKQNTTMYMRVFNETNESKCGWVMVDERAQVYSDLLYTYNPLKIDLSSLPPSSFECDFANINDTVFYPSGTVCRYFDIS